MADNCVPRSLLILNIFSQHNNKKLFKPKDSLIRYVYGHGALNSMVPITIRREARRHIALTKVTQLLSPEEATQVRIKSVWDSTRARTRCYDNFIGTVTLDCEIYTQ